MSTTLTLDKDCRNLGFTFDAPPASQLLIEQMKSLPCPHKRICDDVDLAILSASMGG